MGFFDSNFWEQPKNFLSQIFQNATAPVNFKPTPPPQGIPQGTPWSKPFDPVATTLRMSAYIPGTNIPKPNGYDALSESSRSVPGPSNSGSSALADREIRDKLQPKLWGALGQIGDAAFGAVDDVVANDPMSIYEQIRNATPGYEYKGPTAEAMANSQFDPIFKMLAAQRAQGTQRYGTQKAEAIDSYGDYVDDLTASKAGNQATYAQAAKDIAAAGQTASNTVSAESQEANAAMAKIMQGLGQQHTAGELLGKNQASLNEQLGNVAANQTQAANLNTALGASTATHDQDTINFGKQAGLSYQGDILRDYNDLLSANDQQNLQLQGQKGEAQNKYTMSIEELLANAAGDREGAISKQFEAFMDQNFRNQQLELDKRRLSLDATKAGIGPDGQPIAGSAADVKKQPQVVDAYRILESEASSLSPNLKQPVMSAILASLRDNGGAKDIGTLLRGVDPEILKQPNVADIAYRFFAQYLGNT